MAAHLVFISRIIISGSRDRRVRAHWLDQFPLGNPLLGLKQRAKESESLDSGQLGDAQVLGSTQKKLAKKEKKKSAVG